MEWKNGNALVVNPVFRRETRWDERERENADISCNDDDDYYEEENDYSVLFYTMTTSY